MSAKRALRSRVGRGERAPTPRWLAIGATAVAAVVVAEAAAWLLRPRDAIEPATVEESAYFTSEQLERARDFRSGQRLLMAGGIAAQGGVLILLISGRPAGARRVLERAADYPALGGAAAAAGLVAVLSLASLPFDLAAHERSVDVGLSTQDLGDWAVDWSKATTITAVLVAGAGTGALAMMRRFGSRWWLPGSAALVGLAIVFSWLAPVVLAPLFNDFDRLEPGAARDDVIELGERAGVEIGEVYRVDASRRSTALNAYVGGLGPTKRVVLYDNLLEDLARGERRSVVAHELAHVSQRDIQRGILFLAISAPLALLSASRAAEALGRRTGAGLGSPAIVPAVALSLAAASFAIGVVGNQLSRAVEAKADTEALELTEDPQSLIDLQRRLTERNHSDPDPPDAVSFLLGTHPTALERIGAAVEWRRDRPRSAADPSSPPAP